MRTLMLGPSDMLHLRRLVAALIDRGHDVHVVSMRPDAIPGATFERYKVPSFGISNPRRWQQRRNLMVDKWFNEFDVVNVHFLEDWGIDRRYEGGAALIVKAYGSDINPPPYAESPPPELTNARRRLLELADCVVTSGKTFQESVLTFADVPRDRLRVIPNGVDIELFQPLETAPRRAPVIGSHRGFHAPANPLLLIEAAAKVLLVHPSVRFELAGSGIQRDACFERAETLGITHAIRWVGQQAHEDLPRLLAGWDIAAIAAHRESFCVSALESSAMGIPVVATAVGGLNETVSHNDTGLLVPADDADAFAAALISLVKDESLRQRLGTNGCRRVQAKYSWRRSVDAWIELFEEQTANARASLALSAV